MKVQAATRMPYMEREPKTLSLDELNYARVKVQAATRMPSMEQEPKTLSLDELNYAREAALYVLSTHSSEDAGRIFTEGLKPVLGVRRNSMDSDDDDDEDGDMFDPDAFVDDHGMCHQLYERAAKKRGAATAPF